MSAGDVKCAALAITASPEPASPLLLPERSFRPLQGWAPGPLGCFLFSPSCLAGLTPRPPHLTIHQSATALAKGLWRSAEFPASHTGWSSDLALGTASKCHFFAFLEAETPYPTPEYHDLARTGRGANLGPAGSRWEDHD